MSDIITLEELSKGINEIGWDILNMLSKKEFMCYADFMSNLDLCMQKCCLEIARLEGALMVKSKPNPKKRNNLLFFITDIGNKTLSYRP